MNDRLSPIKLFLTVPEPCPYIPDRQSSSVVVDPAYDLSNPKMSQLTRIGFRRSGDIIYRPHCKECKACISVRIPVREFHPSRSQRRNMSANQDLYISQEASIYSEEQFRLYLKYQRARHPKSSMCDDDPEKYRDFLISNFSNSAFYCIYLEDKLLSVAIVDHLDAGLSGVYTFYDPDHDRRGLGIYSILRLIEETRSKRLHYLYLGYWIEDSEKMSYKKNFHPLEGYIDGSWRTL
jgi:arginyl-tRNA--protein-N-Asp/Glu arginylyltransferase